MQRFFFAYVCICVSILTGAFAQAPQSPVSAKPKQVVPKIERAQWTKESGDFASMTQDDFASMGLSKLTKDEYQNLILWANTQEGIAQAKGVSEGKDRQKTADSFVQTFSCGPTLDEKNSTKVHVLINEGNNNSAEIMSELRSQLRSISDVQIVYSLQDADVELSVVSFELHLADNQHRHTGYVMSVVVGTPCKGKFGTNEWDFRTVDDNILQTGGTDPRGSVSSVVASLDSDFEQVRKSHAGYLKFLEDLKKQKDKN